MKDEDWDDVLRAWERLNQLTQDLLSENVPMGALVKALEGWLQALTTSEKVAEHEEQE